MRRIRHLFSWRMSATDQSGFTLLETMIAVAIMLVAFSSILMVESASINTSMKSKQMNIVAILAKRAMVEAENEFQGMPFNEVKEEEAGRFEEPFQDYSWSRQIKEIEFPSLGVSAGEDGEGADASSGPGNGTTRTAETLTKLVTNYLSEAVREVTITISWKKGEGTQSYILSTYWVNLNNEFSLSQQ